MPGWRAAQLSESLRVQIQPQLHCRKFMSRQILVSILAVSISIAMGLSGQHWQVVAILAALTVANAKFLTVPPPLGSIARKDGNSILYLVQSLKMVRTI